MSRQPAEHQRTMLELSSSVEQEGSKRQDAVGLYQDYLFLPPDTCAAAIDSASARATPAIASRGCSARRSYEFSHVDSCAS